MPDKSFNMYRVFFEDDSFTDIEGNNASEVKENISNDKKIIRIANFKSSYPEILLHNKHDIIQNEELKISLEVQTIEDNFCEFLESETIDFQEINFNQYINS